MNADVVRFFRAMGQGHLTRMNDVLRAFMLARLAEVVKAQMEYKPPPALEEEYRARMNDYSELLLARIMEG